MSQEEQPQYPTVTGELSFILFSLTPTVSHPLTWLDLLDNLITSARDCSQTSPNNHFSGLNNLTMFLHQAAAPSLSTLVTVPEHSVVGQSFMD